MTFKDDVEGLVEACLERGYVSNDMTSIARMVFELRNILKPVSVGQWLTCPVRGSRTMRALYMMNFDFKETSLADAFHTTLLYTSMPQSSRAVSKIIRAMTNRYWQSACGGQMPDWSQAPAEGSAEEEVAEWKAHLAACMDGEGKVTTPNEASLVFPTADSVYTTAYSALILNADLTSPAIKVKMTRLKYMQTGNALNDMGEVGAAYLGLMYDALSRRPLPAGVGYKGLRW
jgi:Sec7-like guanine-nucleotide exchange factor